MFKEIDIQAISKWPTPNYVNPTTRGAEIYSVTGVFLSIATISLLARLYSRIFIRRYFGPDDGLIVFAYIATLGVTACVAVGNENYGWDRHIWDVLPTKIPGSMHTLYFARICWGLATSSVRLSICCLYYRLLDRVHGPKSFRWVLHIFTGFTVALALVYIFTGIFPCIPIRAYWTFSRIPGQKCDDDVLVMQACAIMNTVSEFVIAVMPIIAVYRLRIDPRQRWTVISLLSLSFFVAFAGCFRTYYLWKAMAAKDFDMSWWADPHFIASEVEIDISITCACAAPLRPLIGYIFRRIKGLPSRLPSITPRRPSMSTFTSKTTTTKDYEAYSGWSTPIAHYFDLEGIACDGYGYTVTISGPLKKHRSSRLRKRKSIRDSESGDPVLQHPAQLYHSPKPQSKALGLFDIETTKEVEVRESFHMPRTSEELNRVYRSKHKIPDYDEIERASNKNGKSWFQE